MNYYGVASLLSWGGFAAAIVSLDLEGIASVITAAVALISAITSLVMLVIKFVKWIKSSLADGKIDKDELDELEEIINASKQVQDALEEDRKEKEKSDEEGSE